MDIELLRKHKDRLLEATTNVRQQQRTSKKGKIFTVKAHERNIDKLKNDVRSAEHDLSILVGTKKNSANYKNQLSRAQQRVEGAYRKLQMALDKRRSQFPTVLDKRSSSIKASINDK